MPVSIKYECWFFEYYIKSEICKAIGVEFLPKKLTSKVQKDNITNKLDNEISSPLAKKRKILKVMAIEKNNSDITKQSDSQNKEFFKNLQTTKENKTATEGILIIFYYLIYTKIAFLCYFILYL